MVSDLHETVKLFCRWWLRSEVKKKVEGLRDMIDLVRERRFRDLSCFMKCRRVMSEEFVKRVECWFGWLVIKLGRDDVK